MASMTVRARQSCRRSSAPVSLSAANHFYSDLHTISAISDATFLICQYFCGGSLFIRTSFLNDTDVPRQSKSPIYATRSKTLCPRTWRKAFSSTLHQRHIGKVPCLFLIDVRHYFRVLVVMSSMRMALSPQPSEKIIGEWVVRRICTLGFSC